MQRQLIDPPVRQSIPQSGLIDGRQVIGALPGNVAEAAPAPAAAAEKPKKPRAPRKPKAEESPVPPAAPPAPVEKAKKAKAAPAAPGPETSPVSKAKFVKGSEEAKAHMAKLREAAKKKKAAIAAASKTPEGGSDVDDIKEVVPAKKKAIKKKVSKGDKIELEMEA